jgi:hypothetical protein
MQLQERKQDMTLIVTLFSYYLVLSLLSMFGVLAIVIHDRIKYGPISTWTEDNDYNSKS